MPKRIGNLFEKIISLENLKLAHKKARKNKTKKHAVKEVDKNIEELLIQLHDQLVNGEFHTSPYHTKTIYEPKERIIYMLPYYPDRIVHHTIMNVLEPIFESMFIGDCYACRKKKGQHKGSIRCMEFVRKYKYCLQCDISKFYPSINHEILKNFLKHKFKDQRLLNLLFEIIDSIEGEVNVPIGNHLSSWFGNFYLFALDMYLKQELHVKAMIRFCDDFCIFSNDKKELNYILEKVKVFIDTNLKLKLSKGRIFPVTQGVDVLGYRHFPDCILVRKSTVKREKKTIAKTVYDFKHNNISKAKAVNTIESIKGWLKHAQSYNLRKKLNLLNLREVIETWSKI